MTVGTQHSNKSNVVNISSCAGYGQVVAHLINEKCVESRHIMLRALLHVIEQQDDIDVVDLSRNGLKGTTNINLNVGERIFLSLDDVSHFTGTVLWYQNNRFGMNFDTPLQTIPTQLQIVTDKGPNHHKRIPSHLSARIFICTAPYRAKIHAVSNTGMKVESDFPLQPEQQLLVSLVNSRIITATVGQVEFSRIGVRSYSCVSVLQFT